MTEKSMTLLKTWDGINPTGWLISEKYDGCRAFWDGRQFWTREGNVIDAPAFIKDGLPSHALDGEIWAGRGGFVSASEAVRLGNFTARHSFIIFDNPAAPGNWLQRLAAVRHTSAQASIVSPETCQGRDHLLARLKAVQSGGGEGLVIRDPRTRTYVQGRTRSALRVKEVPHIFGLLKLMGCRDPYFASPQAV